MRFRISALALAVAAIVWFNFLQDSSAAATAQRAADLFDSRPARSILIVGNSRTYYNDMPSMLRKIADSAGSPTKFQIESIAKPAASFAMHWSDIRTRRMLAAGWDDIILQPDSGAQMHPDLNASFHAHGAKLAAVAKVTHGHSRLLVGWAYDPNQYEGDTDGSYRAAHLERIRWNHTKLAGDSGMATIKLAGLWESVRRTYPSIRLTTDGNHPTAAGSYLYALAVYAHLSNGSVAAVSYVPNGVEPGDAHRLREAVDTFPLLA